MNNCKILHLILRFFSDNQWQRLWEKLLFEQFCVSTSLTLLTMWRNNERKLRQAMLWVRNNE